VSPRPWWISGDREPEPEPYPQGCECEDCAGTGSTADGSPCEWCDGSGETTGETSDGRAACDELDAWHARLDEIDREHEALR